MIVRGATSFFSNFTYSLLKKLMQYYKEVAKALGSLTDKVCKLAKAVNITKNMSLADLQKYFLRIEANSFSKNYSLLIKTPPLDKANIKTINK